MTKAPKKKASVAVGAAAQAITEIHEADAITVQAGTEPRVDSRLLARRLGDIRAYMRGLQGVWPESSEKGVGNGD